MKNLKLKAAPILQSFVLLAVIAVLSAHGQSTNVNYPTPVTSDSVSGRIKARDIGDSRSTVHYYVFEGNQGDIFLKIEATNLNGDIDVFYAENLRPLTKVSIYADTSPTQTGREIYLRKREKLILRVEGRTPNDDPALYSIKFEGSFKTVAANSVEKEPKLPEVKSEEEGEVKVNSIGTIVEAKPTPKPITTAGNTRNRTARTATTPQPVSTVKPKSTKTVKEEPKVDEEEESEKKSEVITTDNLPKENVETVAKKEPKPKTTKKKTPVPTRKTTTTKKTTEKVAAKPNSAAELAKAMENIRLIVDFKDGGRVERPMNDILRFGVDKGVLTIINKDGSIGKYSILDVTKITVE